MVRGKIGLPILAVRNYQLCCQCIKSISALEGRGQGNAAAAAHSQAITLPQLHLHDGGRILVDATALSDAHCMEWRLGTVHAGQRGCHDA